MAFTVSSPQSATYALATTDSIAICGTSTVDLTKVWSQTGEGPSSGNPGIGGASPFGPFVAGTWTASSVSAAGQGPFHVHVWYLEVASSTIVWAGATNFNIVRPGSGSASGTGVLLSGACPHAIARVVEGQQAPVAVSTEAFSAGGGAVVITDAAPKYYRVYFHDASLQLPEPAASLLSGAALRQSPITLQYDPAWSLPMQAVWTGQGRSDEPIWMLSVTREASGRMHAVLALSRQGAMQVKAPFAWASDGWAFGSCQWLKWCGVPHDVGLPSIALEPVFS